MQFVFLIRAGRSRDHCPFAIMGNLRTMSIFRLIRRCVNRFVFRLWRPDFMIIYGLIVIQLLECRTFFWFGKARIKKSVIAHPAYVGEFRPFDFVWQHFAGRGVKHPKRTPVRPTILNGICQQRTVL